MANIFLAYDADNAGRLIGAARLQDDAEKLARVSGQIDKGNELFKNWAIDHGGSMISSGGDEGIISIPVTALEDLPNIKTKYESALSLTVSIGVGLKMSQAFKALLASKLRGKNRTTIYDKEVEKEIAEASKSEDDTKKKIVEEYLTKAQAIHGQGGAPADYQVQEQSSNPEIQQQNELRGFSPIEPTSLGKEEDHKKFEELFSQLADEAEKKDTVQKAGKSQQLAELKSKVADALEAVHKQMPQLAEIKRASPETYQAVLGVVQGLIAIGKQIQNSEQELSKSIKPVRRFWTGGGTTIPALGTPQRKAWDNNYKQAVANYFAEGQAHKLKEVEIPVEKLIPSHISIMGNEAKNRLYTRMVQGGDKMPHLVVYPQGSKFQILDGNRRRIIALTNGVKKLKAFIPLTKGEVNTTYNPALPPSGMKGMSTGGFQNFDYGMDKTDLSSDGLDPEQLAIGTQVELVLGADSEDEARQIATDHLMDNPNFYQEEDEPMSEDKEELDPSKNVNESSKVLDKDELPGHIQSLRQHRKLVPGEILDSRHVVVQNSSGKNAIREVSSGMQRDLNDSVSNPIGPAQGNPTSTRNRPSRV